jgi:D-glycero-alpha-D-manno-heptose-7-phosphate kinase
VRYHARVPLRIDFGGSWTDAPEYSADEGGAVLSAAITCYARGYISRPEHRSERDIPTARIGDWLRHMRGDTSHLTYSLDVPPGAGLGASAAQTVLWVTLVTSSILNVLDRREIAAFACRTSEALGTLGGAASRQLPRADEYASALGGINYLSFGDEVLHERITLDSAAVDALRRRLVLVYCGQRRQSGALRDAVWSRYRSGDRSVARALAALARLAGEMKVALVTGDLDAFGELIDENWENQKALCSEITDDRVQDIIDLAISSGAAGAKVVGAGSAGSVLLVARTGAEQRLRDAVSRRGHRTIDFDFDTYGVYVTKEAVSYEP